MIVPEELQVVEYPHPALRWKSKPVTRIDTHLKKIVERMFELMYEHKGVGLAANQVGLPYRVFVINPSGEPDNKEWEMVLINPEITSRKGSAEGEEGCLSVPEVYGDVSRSEEIVVDAFDLKGEGFELSLKEFPARVVQHEYDHIDGIMFFDKLTEASKKDVLPQVEQFVNYYRTGQEKGEIPSDDDINKRLKEIEP
ncbi:Peptide deformylase [Polystyrenella longa]|uniref:Peptide deformylase n=1 Tax=Polystyrenella longa TaxID=2528007 RepID=A0A518CQK7_9PLAN|nr:peptide deformylase [Polystyrenella longa]QDU81516.1 Peptide deformylase [Polystyrenella longa]